MKQTAPAYKETNLKIIFAVTLTMVMGVASITPAFPEIVERLSITTRDVGLLITVFTLPGIFLTPFMGIMADRYGRKKVLGPSLIIFALAGTTCGFITDFKLLLVFRFFQGVGGAALSSLSTTLIGDLYSGKRLSEAMGYNSSLLSVGTAGYPALGGLLASFGWNYPFFLPVLALPVGLLVMFKLKNPEPEKRQNLKDYLKNVIKIFQSRQVVALMVSIMGVFVVLYGSYLTYFPFLMRGSFGSSTFTIGLWMSVTSVVSGVVSWQLRLLTQKYPEKYLLITGFILYLGSMVSFALIRVDWLIWLPLGLFGAGSGLIIPTTQGMLTALSPMQYRAAFMAANGMTLRFGQTAGPILMGFFYTLAGLNGAFLAGAGVVLLLICLIVLMVSNSNSTGR